MSTEKKKPKPEWCYVCQSPVWDWEWIEGKNKRDETVGMTACSKHKIKAKEIIEKSK